MKCYLYQGTEYRNEREVRQAIFKEERKAFGKPKTIAEWAQFGVEIVEAKSTVAKEQSIELLKELALGRIGAAFEAFRKSSKTYIYSSLGFKVNANTTAFENVSGLVAQLQYRQDEGELDPVVSFMTYDDETQNLSLAQMKTIQMEISSYGTRAYEYKWGVKAKVRACSSKEELDAIVIDFSSIGH